MLAHVLVDGAATQTRARADVQRALLDGAHVWVDLEARTPETEAMLAEDFKLHPLVIEDIWAERALPKLEDFDEYLFILVHGICNGEDKTEVGVQELDLVLSPEWLITYHPGAGSVAALRDELQRSPRVLKKGPVWVAHALLDHLVDQYLPVLDHFDDLISTLEDDVIAKAGTPDGKAVLERIFCLRRGVQRIRRTSFVQREILIRLTRGELDEIPPEAVPFFRDVYDHFARVAELAEAHRELLSGALEAYLSTQGNRMNEVMKTLTLISTIMLPLTFIAGVYGMNFQHMPELGWRYGYPYALGLMAAVTIGIMVFFRRRRWL